ncbi:formate-dependent phosphoribosylglycinamide formyltransferase [Mycobacterium sp. E2479]|uniref:formate-dependent phosphoribosylglycinamide formyltransferase n=1 Tax=Mycobacterium sp. E2479 TaxID=1834134 RepID=UPI0007FE727B|nr:formate-dependent phosphoribosylglycinamide formyltransferase [Mycobacterium sp. E2479]OBH50179.1 phosphoribosylglycinamide formyltransferase 2 [Mycobacterium sp. E2479]
MTDGAPDGRDDETTALAVPQQAPAPAEAQPGGADGRPTVVLLGSGETGRELAIALGRLGARVVAVDQHPHAPAHGVADQALVLALTDAAELSAALQRLQPDFVVTATAAVAVEALDAVATANRTELVPSARAARLSADREGLRRLAADELGLPTAPFWFVGSPGELEAVGAHAGYPLLIKPAAGPIGPRQSVVGRREELEPAWQRAVGGHAGPGQPRVLAETVVEVEVYVTLLAVRSEGPAGPVIEFCSPIGHRDSGGQVLESWQPQKLSAAATDAAKSIAARIAKALGGRGVFAVELMVNGDEVYFADVTSHPTDSVWVTLRSQRLSAFELAARTILDLPVDTMMVSPAAARAIDSVPSHGPAALTGALSVPESDVRVVGRGYRALATAPEVTAARERAGQVADRLAASESSG